MSRLLVACVLCVGLAGCGGGYERFEPPIVDSYGHTPDQLAKDQHECIEAKRAHGFVGDAQMITNCMQARGYQILARKG